MERTLLLVKPDGVRRRLVGEIIRRVERKGLTLLAARLLTLDRQTAEEHYAEHAGKPFFPELLSFITSGPLMAMAVEGREAVRVVRTLMGATDPVDAAPGTVRGDLGLDKTENLVHGSDSPESAARELALFFPGLV